MNRLHQDDHAGEPELPHGYHNNVDQDAENFWENGHLDTLHKITEDKVEIERLAAKICQNLRDQTWTWPNPQDFEHQDFSRPGLKFSIYFVIPKLTENLFAKAKLTLCPDNQLNRQQSQHKS